MRIAKEGIWEIVIATLVLGTCGTGAALLAWPAAIPFAIVWLWVISFFRDPRRVRAYDPGDLCAPADGTVTEISELADYEPIGGPAVRIGIFLSLFNVHINRAACPGTVRVLSYHTGVFLDARNPESGRLNESNTLLIDTDAPVPGPIEIRQVAGLVARRIVCHAKANDHLARGERFGLIKFGSRTELIIPHMEGTEVLVRIGDRVRAGLTILARQAPSPVTAEGGTEKGRARSEKALT